MIELLRNRRSIRKFKSRAIESEKIELLKEALLRSPTSRNRNPWEYIIVENKDIIKSLSIAKPHGLAFLSTAPFAVVICGNEDLSDAWIEDCSISSIILQLTAQSLGLGSCWGQIRMREHSGEKFNTAEEYVQNLLEIPENIKVESIIGIGYPDEVKNGIFFENLPTNKFHINNF